MGSIGATVGLGGGANPGDIEGVTVTAPITGGGTSGTVAIGIVAATTLVAGSMSAADKIRLDGAALLAAVQTFTKAQGSAKVALTDAANIATDASLGNVFSVTLGGNRTLDNPTNLVSGFTYIWVITQDGAGSRTLAYGNLFKWPGGTIPTLSTAIGAVDTISAVYDGTRLCAVCQKAFA